MSNNTAHMIRSVAPVVAAFVLFAGSATACAQAARKPAADVGPKQAQTESRFTQAQPADKMTVRATRGGRIAAETPDGPRLTADVIELKSADGTLTHRLSSGQDGQLQLSYTDIATPKVQIGVTMEPVSHALASQLGLELGHAVLLTYVKKGQAAEKAGLRQYDVITGVNGDSPVTPKTLREVVGKSSPGDKIDLDVIRGGSKLRVTIEVEPYSSITRAADLAYRSLTDTTLQRLDVTRTIDPVVTTLVTPEITSNVGAIKSVPLLSPVIRLNRPEAKIESGLYQNLKLQMEPIVIEGQVSLLPQIYTGSIQRQADLTSEAVASDPGDVDTTAALLDQIRRLRSQLDRIEALLEEADRD